MEDLSLHILDIVENSLRASADTVEITIREDTKRNRLSLEIRDNGRGMTEEERKRALDPFFTTKENRKYGLGLALLAQAAEESGGGLELQSEPGRGTTVRAEFDLGHPDSKPLGDVAATLRTLLFTNPELKLKFEYRRDSELVAALNGDRSQREEL